MPDIAPFAALRYDAARLQGDLSSVLAPPYDVLDDAEKLTLLRRNDRNIVAIDLPHAPAKELGPPEAYTQSAKFLREWIADRTLLRDPAPAMYAYHQRFRHDNRNYTRRMFIARAWLTPFSDGPILPHEKTFGGPKEDRLALMRATKCNLSPVFAIYSDPNRRIDSMFSTLTESKPAASGQLDHVDNLLWVASDRAVVSEVTRIMSDLKVYIADGHHRYETAFRYRDELASRQQGKLPADHPANFVMLVFACMEDPGCLILPYHRVLTNIDVRTLLQVWSPGTHPAPPETADIVIQDGRSQDRAYLSFTARGKLAALEPKQPAPWHQLDTAYLHRYLIDELSLSGADSDRPTQVLYVKSAEDAQRTARQESGVALLLNPTPMAHLRAVSESGALMPQKSTFFHPKLATGLTINPLE